MLDLSDLHMKETAAIPIGVGLSDVKENFFLKQKGEFCSYHLLI